MKDFIDNKTYSIIHLLMPIVCVDIIIRMNDKVLLVKRNNEPEKNEYYFPGGRLLKHESLMTAVKRISMNEVGVNLDRIFYVDFAETIFDSDPFNHNNGTHTINFVYTSKVENQQVLLDNTSKNYILYDGQVNVTPYIKNMIAKSTT